MSYYCDSHTEFHHTAEWFDTLSVLKGKTTLLLFYLWGEMVRERVWIGLLLVFQMFQTCSGTKRLFKIILVVKKALQKLGSSYLKRLDMHVSLQSLCCSLPFCCLPALICGSCLEDSESFITGFKHFLLGLCCALICPFTVRAEREQNKYAIILLDELWLTAGNNSKSAKPFSFY